MLINKKRTSIYNYNYNIRTNRYIYLRHVRTKKNARTHNIHFTTIYVMTCSWEIYELHVCVPVLVTFEETFLRNE